MSDPRRLGQTARRLDQRARAFQPALRNWWLAWLTHVGHELLRPGREAGLETMTVAKVDTATRRSQLRENLQALLRRYGSVTAADSVTEEIGRPSQAARSVTQTFRWFSFEASIADAVERSAVDRLLAAGRRVAASGQPLSAGAVIAEAALDSTFNAASGLARNVLATADTVGKDTAYDELGIEFVQWLAFTIPIFDRRHDLLNGVVRRRGEPFKMPVSGAELLFPHDPAGPIGEVIHCRCSQGPVIKGTEAWRRAMADGLIPKP